MNPLLGQRARVDRAFERMYRRHIGDVYRYALAVLGNPADAEDVAQTTFLNAYRAFQRGERPRKPENWLIRIAHNVCRQRFRQTARRPNEVAFDEDVAEAVVRDADVATPRELTLALSRLAFNQRAALVMRELEGRSYVEIAQTLALTVAAVETLLFRARRALREQLEGGLTCREAELAISRQLDDRLPRPERGALRAHLRECKDCATFARSQRAQRAAWKGLAAIPLPSSLASFFGGGGGAAVGTGAATAGLGFGVAAKATAFVGAAALAGGVGYQGVKHGPWRAKQPQTVEQKAVSPAPSSVSAIRQADRPASLTTLLAANAAQRKPRMKAAKVTKRKVKMQKTPPRQAKKKVTSAAPTVYKARGKAIGRDRSEKHAKTKAREKAKPQQAAPAASPAKKAGKKLAVKPKVKAKRAQTTLVPRKQDRGSNGRGKK